MSNAFETECNKTGACVSTGVELRNVLMSLGITGASCRSQFFLAVGAPYLPSCCCRTCEGDGALTLPDVFCALSLVPGNLLPLLPPPQHCSVMFGCASLKMTAPDEDIACHMSGTR